MSKERPNQANQNKHEHVAEGVKLSPEEIQHLLNKYGERGLEEDPEHSEYLKIRNTRIQKLSTIGRIGAKKGADGRLMGGKPKKIEQRIRELLGLEEEKW
ncbi:MAG: hypothetical protein HYT93_03175 [Parcubacteria group bacterium]|nr:hypothetical protein [Parcubacteria group bacterium]